LATCLVAGLTGAALATRQWFATAETVAPHVIQLPPMDRGTVDTHRRANELWICADPDNPPFSTRDGSGFENRITEVVVRALGKQVRYLWQPQRTALMQHALDRGDCDLLIGIPATDGMTVTRAYYRSAYVFVTRPDRRVVRSFADRRLRDMKIAIQVTGDESESSPARALAERNLAAQVRGFIGDSSLSQGRRPGAIVDAVARGDVDAAAVWGPLGGYYAALQHPQLTVTPITDDHTGTIPFAFDIVMRCGQVRSPNAIA
jgi:mxaJ protein